MGQNDPVQHITSCSDTTLLTAPEHRVTSWTLITGSLEKHLLALKLGFYWLVCEHTYHLTVIQWEKTEMGWSEVGLVLSMLTLVPWCRRTVHTAGQAGSIGTHPWLTCSWLSEGPNSTGARACKLAWEMHCESPESTVRVIYWVGGPPTWFLLDEGVVGWQGAVGRARVEVQQLGPLATTNRHSAATTSSRYGWHRRCWR